MRTARVGARSELGIVQPAGILDAMERTTLYYMPYSPWSHKTRFALRHHKLALHEHAYTPLIDEPALRLRLRKWSGRVTVPILFAPDRTLTDSWDIVDYADRHGSGNPLIPTTAREQVADWNAASERLLGASRYCTMLRALEAPEVLLDVVPKPVASLLGRRGALISARLFNAKYKIRASERPRNLHIMREELSRLRGALADGRRYLLGELSYADVAMSIALMMLGFLHGETVLGPRRLSVETDLVEEHADLLAWRDAFHAQHPLLSTN